MAAMMVMVMVMMMVIMIMERGILNRVLTLIIIDHVDSCLRQ